LYEICENSIDRNKANPVCSSRATATVTAGQCGGGVQEKAKKKSAGQGQ
jgi:hypothetical protein